MNIAQLTSKLRAQGIKCVELTLQLLECKDGSLPLVYSTYRKSQTIKLFGSEIEASVSMIDTSVPKSTSRDTFLWTAWVSDKATDYQAIADRFGATAIGIIDVATNTMVPHTLQQAEALLNTDTTSDASSEQVPATF